MTIHLCTIKWVNGKRGAPIFMQYKIEYITSKKTFNDQQKTTINCSSKYGKKNNNTERDKKSHIFFSLIHQKHYIITLKEENKHSKK
eukprot:267875_1